MKVRVNKKAETNAATATTTTTNKSKLCTTQTCLPPTATAAAQPAPNSFACEMCKKSKSASQSLRSCSQSTLSCADAAVTQLNEAFWASRSEERQRERESEKQHEAKRSDSTTIKSVESRNFTFAFSSAGAVCCCCLCLCFLFVCFVSWHVCFTHKHTLTLAECVCCTTGRMRKLSLVCIRFWAVCQKELRIIASLGFAHMDRHVCIYYFI